jgi:hypothetical protein
MNLYSPQRVTKSCRKLGNQRTHAACLQSAHAEKIRCRRRARAHTHIPSIARAHTHIHTKDTASRSCSFEAVGGSPFSKAALTVSSSIPRILQMTCGGSGCLATVHARRWSQNARTHRHTHTHRRTHMPTSDHTGARGHATLGERPSCQDARRQAIFSKADAVGDEQCARVGKTSTHAGRNKRARSKTTRACG